MSEQFIGVLPILAGDGYECSNQRLLQLVLEPPVDPTADQIVIDDGRHSVTLTLDDSKSAHWRIVEGHSRAWKIPH